MMIKSARYNIYFCAALVLMLACGCELHRSKDKREVTTVSLHLEEDPDGISDITQVSIYRESPIIISVNREPFLDSRTLEDATLRDEPGGLFSIRLKFNWEGAAILDTVTSSNPGKRIAIYAEFKEKRWLACPMVSRRISDGVLIFTPDATHEEAEHIVGGLTNVAAEMKKELKHQSTF